MGASHSPLWQGLQNLLSSEQKGERYLLVNQGALAQSMKTLQGLAPFAKQPLLGQTADAWQDSATPFLLSLQGLASDEHKLLGLRRLCDDACYGSALSIIASELPLQALAGELTIRCDALLPDNFEVLLRYFDTRILASLIEVLTAEQSANFFACALHWHYADRRGAWVQAHSADAGAERRLYTPLALTLSQQNALIQAGEADAVVDVLLRNQIEPLLDMPYPDRHPTISGLLDAAAKWALNSTPDLAAYCALALLRGANFDETEPWRSPLKRVKQGDIKFAEALSLVEMQLASSSKT